MAILAVSNLSAYAWMIALDDSAQIILSTEEWTSTETKDVSSQYPGRLESLLKKAGIDRKKIQRIVILNGPGTFTGLRNSMSFCLGLSGSLEVPLSTLAAYDLFQRPFFIPTRHQLAQGMTESEARAANLEFLKISSTKDAQLSTPATGDLILGLRDRSNWPSPEEIQRALQQGLDRAVTIGIEIVYGLNPKISGQR